MPCIRLSSCLVELVERDRRAVLAAAQLAVGAHSKPSGGVLRVVGDDDVGAGAADRGQRLEHGGALVEQCPAAAAALTIAYSPLTL